MRQKLLFLLICTLLIPLNVLGFTVDGINYEVTGNGDDGVYTAQITGYTGNPTDVVIPETVMNENGEECRVIRINGRAFNECTTLRTIQIPNTITLIGGGAFNGCPLLKSVVIPESVTEIEGSAFSNCPGLVSVEIPSTVTKIGDAVFYGCTSLSSVKLPEGIKTIEGRTFYACESIRSIEIPSSVEKIGSEAFHWCKSLESIVIPEKVTYIEGHAFMECLNLKTVTLPNSLTILGDACFNRCPSLDSIEIPNSVHTIGASAFEYCSNLTSISISESVTIIPHQAFQFCEKLSAVKIPESVTTIDSRAFYGCGELTTVVLLNSDVEIGSEAFSGVMSIENRRLTLYIPHAPEVDYPGIYEVIVFDPETTEILPDGTMLADNGKTLMLAMVKNGGSYTIPDGVVTIKSNSFPKEFDYNTSKETLSLESLTIPASVEMVEADAFADVTINRVNFEDWPHWCANVTLGNLYSNPYYHSESTPYAGGVQITTPPALKEGMTEINDYVNYGLAYKDEVELPSTLKRIGAYAFYNNKELYHVFLNDGLEEIGEHAFDGCELLENHVFPASLKKIEAGAYRNCKSLTEIELPEGLTTLGILENENIEEINSWSWENWLSLHYVPRPIGVFEGCTSIEKATLACDVDYIGNYTFKNCTSLNKIYFPLHMKSIGNFAFANCTALDEVKFPSTLETIGDGAFYNGGSLSKLVVPNSVTSIGQGAFDRQPLQSITLGSGIKTIKKNAFARNYALKSISLSEGLEEIESGAFHVEEYEDSNISSVVLPTTLTKIGENAFGNCNIQELVIPDGVTSLPAGSCGKPSTLTIGKDIKEINANAFGFDNLITFRLMATMPPTLNEAFPLNNDQNDRLTLVVNQDRKKYYQTNARWKQIDNIVEESETDVIVYLDGQYTLAEEVRMQSGLMPSRVSKLKVVGPLTEQDLRVIRENMVSLRSLDLSEVDNVTVIPGSQFAGSLLTEVILPSNTVEIGANAFENCSLLQLSELPETVKIIGGHAFAHCPGVTIMRLPEALETLGYSAFEGCTGLREITAGSNLRTLDYNCFSGCSLLEKVDLSQSALTYIDGDMFSGCSELEDIRLSENITSIGSSAFSETAIRDISFLPTSVESIGENAFSNCRRLVAATLPEKLTSVAGNLFANCPRLLAVSMPSGITWVGQYVINNDKKLANLSCAAVTAPEAETGAFDNIRLRYVSLTVPTLSYRSYLSAPQWGRFETILNRIQIPVNMDKGVEVTNVAETDYQEMLKDDALEEAQELASAEQQGEEQAQIARRRVARRAAARVATNRSFATLFDGAQIQPAEEGAGTRIFINPQQGVTLTSVKFNGEEMISKMDGNSLLLPTGSNGNLEIRTSEGSQDPDIDTGLSEIDYNEAYEVYDLNGLKVADSRDSLLPGIYVIRQGRNFSKIIIK